MPTIVRQTAMTPRDQVQEQAQIAAKKVREAMVEFAAVTGMRATVDVSWLQMDFICASSPKYVVQDVSIRFADEARA